MPSVRAGRFHGGDCFELLGCWFASNRFDLLRVAAAVVDGDHVGHAGDDAEILHDRGLDRLAIAAIRDVKGNDTRRSAGAQVLKDGALDCVFRPTAVAGAAHGTPFGTGFACGKRSPPMTLIG
jgi:hypothetical protein